MSWSWRMRVRVWVSCLVLAACVRAAEDIGVPLATNGVDAVSGASAPSAPATGNDAILSRPTDALTADPDLFIDDEGVDEEGSGGNRHDPDVESSGSGWGPDDEDTRAGSGATPVFESVPTDDEDYAPRTTRPDIFIPILSSPRPKEEKKTRILIEEEPGSPRGGPIVVAELPGNTDGNNDDINVPEDEKPTDDLNEQGSAARPSDNVVFIMNAKTEDRATSFFAQPGILAAVIGGAVVGLLCAILVVMFIVYRMRKKDEGSYALDEPKRSPAASSYGKGHNNREFYA